MVYDEQTNFRFRHTHDVSVRCRTEVDKPINYDGFENCSPANHEFHVFDYTLRVTFCFRIFILHERIIRLSIFFGLSQRKKSL